MFLYRYLHVTKFVDIKNMKVSIIMKFGEVNKKETLIVESLLVIGIDAILNGRDGEIRTLGLLLPKQAR